MKQNVLLSLTFLCWELANVHGFVEDFDSQSQSRGQSHLSFFVVLLQHGHSCLWPRSRTLKTQQGSSGKYDTISFSKLGGTTYTSTAFTQNSEEEQAALQEPSHSVNPDLQHCCCQYRLPSSLRSCRWGHSDTAENHNVCPSPCRAEKHQTVSSLTGQTRSKILSHSTVPRLWRSKRETIRWKRSCLPPNCVYACLMSHKAVTSCSQGIGSWYWSKYLKKNQSGYNTQHREKENLINVRLFPESHLCAISRSSFVSTFASDVIPATLQAMSLENINMCLWPQFSNATKKNT